MLKADFGFFSTLALQLAVAVLTARLLLATTPRIDASTLSAAPSSGDAPQAVLI